MSPKRPYVLTICTLNRAKIGQNSGFCLFYKNGFHWIHRKRFLSSLELLLEGSKIKGLMGPNLSWTYLGDYWANFHDSKVIWNPFGPIYVLAWSFPSGALGGLRSAHGTQIFSEMWYISANTGLIFTIMKCKGYMVTFNTRSLFTLTPDIICWSFCQFNYVVKLVRPSGLFFIIICACLPKPASISKWYHNIPLHTFSMIFIVRSKNQTHGLIFVVLFNSLVASNFIHVL